MQDFQDGQTQNIGGVTYVRQGGQWHAQSAASAPAQPQSVTLGTPKPPEPKTTYSPLPQSDPRFRPEFPSAQISTDGKIDYGPESKSGEVAQKQEQNAAALLKAAGVDIQTGKDPVADLIKGSTSGPLQHLGAEAYSVTGHATPGMQNIGKLKTIVSDMVLQLTGGGLGNQVSDADRQFIIERVGNLADPNVPADQRLASWEAVKQRMSNILGVQPASPPITDEQVVSELQARVRRGDNPADTIHWLVSVGRPPSKEQIAQIIAGTGHGSTIVDPPQDPNGGGGLGHMFAVGAGGVAQGAGDFLGALSNPAIQGYNALTGSNIRPDFGANLRDTLGLPAAQNDQEQLAATINNYGTQALGFGGAARALAPLVEPVAGAVGSALSRIGSAPLTDSAAGATGGAASDLTRQAGGGPVAQAAAGLAAPMAAVPAASRIATSRLSNALLGGPDILPPPVIRAGQAENVRVNRMMFDPNAQTKATAVGKTMVGSRMLQKDMRSIGSQIEARKNALGGNGDVLNEPAALGGAVQNIGRRYIKTSGAEFKNLYGTLRNESAGVPIPATEATTQIDGILARLNKAPQSNAKEIAYLEGVKSDIANGIDVETARDIGSKLSKDISKGDVTFGKSEADVLGIRKALARDTENGLAAAGKADTAARYREVDAAYSKRMDFIKQKLQGLLGRRDNPLDPEKAAGRLTNMAGKRGDASGLFQILNKATPQERADISATFADMLGRNNKGEFSTGQLATDIANTPPAARVALFGKDGAKSLENVAILAKEHARVSHALGGSPTGLANDYRGLLLSVMFGGGGLGLGVDALKAMALTGAGMGIKLGRDAKNANMLMSTKFTGWLRSAPKTTNPGAIDAHFGRLERIAAHEPALAPEIEKFREMVMRAANENLTPQAAASQPDQGNQ